MPGVYAQANYMEALLDDRYFRPLPFLDYVFGLVILAAFELILIAYRGRWLMKLLSVGVLFVATVAALYMTIMHLGWYVNPSSVGVAAVAIKLLHMAFERPEQLAETRHTEQKENAVIRQKNSQEQPLEAPKS